MQNALGQGVSSALQAYRTKLEIDNMRETNKQISSQVGLNKALQEAARKDAVLKSASAKAALSNAEQSKAATASMMAKLPQIMQDTEIGTSAFGRSLSYLERAATSAKSALDLTGGVKHLFGGSKTTVNHIHSRR